MEDNLDLLGTDDEQLVTVNEAIQAVLKGGQSYKIGTRALTRADLKLLCDMQRRLQARIANSGGGPLFADTVVAVFDGR